eukprot:1487928-Prymnesium_polylepis.1
MGRAGGESSGRASGGPGEANGGEGQSRVAAVRAAAVVRRAGCALDAPPAVARRGAHVHAHAHRWAGGLLSPPYTTLAR